MYPYEETRYTKAVTLSGAIELNRRLKKISDHLAVMFQPEFILGTGDDRTLVDASFTIFWRDKDIVSKPLRTFELGFLAIPARQTQEITNATHLFDSTIATQINETCNTFENNFTPLEQFIPDRLNPSEPDLPFDLMILDSSLDSLFPYVRTSPVKSTELNLDDPQDPLVDDSDASIPFWIDDLNQEKCLNLIRMATKHQLNDLNNESDDMDDFLCWFYRDFTQFQSFIFKFLQSHHYDTIPEKLTIDLNGSQYESFQNESRYESDDEYVFDGDFYPDDIPLTTLRCAYDQTINGMPVLALQRYQAYRIPSQSVSAIVTYADDTQELTMTLTHVPEMIQAWKK